MDPRKLETIASWLAPSRRDTNATRRSDGAPATATRSRGTGDRRPAGRLVVGLFGVVLAGTLLSCSAGLESGEIGDADPSESVSEPAETTGAAPPDPSEPGDADPEGTPWPSEPGVSEGDGAAQPPSTGDPGDEGALPSLTPLEEFQRDCEQGVHEWKQGQVDYPATLTVKLNETLDYNAAIDIREAPLPPGEVIHTDGGPAASEAVFVKCTVAARLVAVGDALEIEEPSNETLGGWVLQEFAPTGLTEWAWTVTATKPVDQGLRLDLRPAIISDADTGDLAYSSSNQASFNTDVHIEATVLQGTAYWFETNWGLIVLICAAVGTGITAFVAWLRKLKKETHALMAR